jgi:hypothetical protein
MAVIVCVVAYLQLVSTVGLLMPTCCCFCAVPAEEEYTASGRPKRKRKTKVKGRGPYVSCLPACDAGKSLAGQLRQRASWCCSSIVFVVGSRLLHRCSC